MRTISLMFIGQGRVGTSLRKRLEAYSRTGNGLEFSVAATVRSRSIELDNGHRIARDPGAWNDVLSLAWDFRRARKDLVILDVSDADALPFHLDLVEDGFTVVTANKRPLVGPYAEFRTLADAIDARNHRASWFEATVACPSSGPSASWSRPATGSSGSTPCSPAR